MNDPRGLAVDRGGRVLSPTVCCCSDQQQDQSLSSAPVMSVCVDGRLKGPFSLWYDQSRRRLYIGEWSGGRVIIIDNLKDFRPN